ncbi:MAG: tetratricopeptide repeat protein [Ktedonobacteraceae bacterium]|nr:tetratricopeptide repeat protein [Ktedonobacteraceae bacterium]
MTSGNGYIGKQIGNYRITGPLNAGAFGNVYKGVHLYLSNREVAIKMMHHTHLGEEDERASFLQEAQFLEKLKHPHILPIYDVGIDEGAPYIIAELAPNGSLRDLMKSYKPNLIPLEETLTILSQIGQALEYVHQQNIVHRDLKPENILFDARRDALLADFGIAVFLETTKTKYVDVIGSPLYMAPEQFEGFASRRSDQYALACIGYEMLTGEPPFTGQHAVIIGMKHQMEAPVPPRQHNPTIPEHVERALLKALAKERNERYPDITSFLAALLDLPVRAQNAATSGILSEENSVPLSVFTPNVNVINRTKEEWLDEGNRLYNIGQFQDALLAFENAIQIDPTFADAYEGKTSALCALGRYQEALTSVETALQLDPNYAASYNDKGDILYEFKSYEDALGYYQRALNLEPDNLEAYLGRATTLCSLGRYEEALAAYDKAIYLDTNIAVAYDGKAWALRQLKQYPEALAFSEKAIQLEPDNALFHMGKGRGLFRLEHYEESLAAFDHAIQLDPTIAQIYDYKADTLYHMRRFNDALHTYEYAIQLDPKLASSYEGKGNVHFNFGHYQEALAAYDQAIMLEPNNASFIQKRGDVLKILGRLEDAEYAYEKARQLGHK